LTIQATICFILRDDKVLLLKKSAGLFGQGKWNAPGGKIQPGESAGECAVREVLEETGLSVRNSEAIGIVHFYKNSQRDNPEWDGHVFTFREFHGSPVAGREGTLQWFNKNSLPYDEMWEDDRFWSHLAIQGGRFEGWFYYSGDFEKLEDHKITLKEGELLARS
jgi:8-oxo-dGTP diphosphatase